MAEPQKKSKPAKISANSVGGFVDTGKTGLRQFGGFVREEWYRDLIGRNGVQVYREMRDNDPIIGAIMFAVEMLLRGVAFHVEGETDSTEDQEAADFVESCLGDMEQSWTDFVAVALSYLHYGWDVHEIVYKLRKGRGTNLKTNSKYDDGMIGWRKLAPRGQETLFKWSFDEETGDALSLFQMLPTGSPIIELPLRKCLHLTTMPVKGNPEGRSILRNAYTSWYYTKRLQEIEAVGAERDLTGLPVAEVPSNIIAGKTADDRAAYEGWKKIVRDVSRNEQEGVILPLVYDAKGNPAYKFSLMVSGGRRLFDTNAIIDRYDHRKAAVVLADFITLGATSGRGSYSQSLSKTDLFFVACAAWLDQLVAPFNRKAIPDLLQVNGMRGSAFLKHGDITRRDLTMLGTYVQDLAAAGMLTPDPVLEEHLREEANLPSPDQNELRDLQQGGDAEQDVEQDLTEASDQAKAKAQPKGKTQVQAPKLTPAQRKAANKRSRFSKRKALK